jgi:hypothetical protein
LEVRSCGSDGELLGDAAQFGDYSTLRDCGPENLSELARACGLDFATAVIYDRVLRDSLHKTFFDKVNSSEPLALDPSVMVAVVPGAFYQEERRTGADGARVMEIAGETGCATARIPVCSFGSLDENARIILDWLAANRERRVVLVTLSKGSADLKYALSLPGAAELFRNVNAWISISGMCQGTPLAGWLRRQRLLRLGVRFVLWWRGQRYSSIEELRHEADGPLARWPELPSHMKVIHMVGFPLRRHLAHPFALRGYERIASHGPNDGCGFLLGEVVNLPGVVYPIWGADHYLQAIWDVGPLQRILLEAMAVKA